jgi:hypothetical protein
MSKRTEAGHGHLTILPASGVNELASGIPNTCSDLTCRVPPIPAAVGGSERMHVHGSHEKRGGESPAVVPLAKARSKIPNSLKKRARSPTERSEGIDAYPIQQSFFRRRQIRATATGVRVTQLSGPNSTTRSDVLMRPNLGKVAYASSSIVVAISNTCLLQHTTVLPWCFLD